LTEPSPSYRAYVASAAFWLAVALVRVGAVLGLSPGLSTDPDAYVALAESWRSSGTYGLIDEAGEPRPTAFRPPAYPALLAVTTIGEKVDPRQIATLHVLLGLGTVLGTFVWGSVACSTKVARLAALGVAIDPVLLHQSAQPMTETLATFLAVWALAAFAWGAKRGSPGAFSLAGLAIGVGCLTRPAFLPVFVLWAVFLLVRGFLMLRRTDEVEEAPRSDGPKLAFLYFAIPAMTLLGGWTLRNQIVLGIPVIATTHGGYTLLLGNNDDFYRWLKDPAKESIWTAERLQADLARPRPGGETETEMEEDRRLQRAAREWIAAHPAAFAECSLYRLGRLWAPVPASVGAEGGLRTAALRFAIGSWYVAAYAFAAIGLFAVRRRLASADFAPALLMTFAFVAIHAFYWTDVRMRAPLLPAVFLFAAAGFCWLVGRFAFRRAERISPLRFRPIAPTEDSAG
jgi:hypothetical protein